MDTSIKTKKKLQSDRIEAKKRETKRERETEIEREWG